jgi:hypothetical protein
MVGENYQSVLELKGKDLAEVIAQALSGGGFHHLPDKLY